MIRADTIARYKTLQGYEVFFNTGTDEHGSKLYTAAQKEGIPVQDYVIAMRKSFVDWQVYLLLLQKYISFVLPMNSILLQHKAFGKKYMTMAIFIRKITSQNIVLDVNLKRQIQKWMKMIVV